MGTAHCFARSFLLAGSDFSWEKKNPVNLGLSR